MTHSPLPSIALSTPSSLARDASYDRGAWLYDLIVANPVYHALAWGASTRIHDAFCRRALLEAEAGPLLDAGSGSLVFTAAAYRGTSRPVTLLDQSPVMLARAQRRLHGAGSSSGGSIDSVVGDVLAMPFASASYAAVCHFGVLHCLTEPERALQEIARVTRPEGDLFMSCLTLARPWGDRLLRALQRRGHVAPPRPGHEYLQLLEAAGYRIQDQQRKGSFLLVHARKLPA